MQDIERLMSKKIDVVEEDSFQGSSSNTSCHESETTQSGSDVFSLEFVYWIILDVKNILWLTVETFDQLEKSSHRGTVVLQWPFLVSAQADMHTIDLLAVRPLANQRLRNFVNKHKPSQSVIKF